MREADLGPNKSVHRYAWLWEPLEAIPSFELRSMFGVKTAYIEGKIMLGFAARREPWRGLLVCTDKTQHASLMQEFPALSPHPVIPKWLMLPESDDDFERVAGRLVALVLRLDPRIGVVPKSRQRRERVPVPRTRTKPKVGQ